MESKKSRKPEDIVKDRDLITPELHGRRLLVALSGGCDSVALLLMLLDAGCTVEAAHCNFHLRGDESDRDEAFVQQLCRERGVTLHRAHFDTRAYAELHHESIELAARNLRYRYFEQLRHDLAFDYIAVAHHRDDQAETVLMHLLRGSGLTGLRGMKRISGHVVRPLLDLSRKQLEDYLQAKQQPYVTDSTNLERDATRNRIRLDILPRLEAVYPQAAAAIARCAAHLAETEKVVSAALEEQRRAVLGAGENSENSESSEDSEDLEGLEGREPSKAPLRLSIERLSKVPSPALLLHHILAPLAFTPAQVTAIAAHLDAPTGRTICSPTHTLVFNRGNLIVAPTAQEALRPLRIPEPGTYVLADGRRLRITLTERTPAFRPSRDPLTATLDAATVTFPLTLRPTAPGDRFQPFGMQGTKLVSDYLTDRHIALPDKQRQLVLTQSGGAIIWLPGHRTAEPCRVNAATRQVLIMDYHQELEN